MFFAGGRKGQAQILSRQTCPRLTTAGPVARFSLQWRPSVLAGAAVTHAEWEQTMTPKITKILVPTDGSPSAVKAARWGLQLAEGTGASLVLLHVFALGAPQLMGMRALGAEEFDKMKRDIADEAMTLTRDALGGTAVPIEEVVVFGDPMREILHAANRFGADNIVMGNRGLSPLKELLIGSVSDKVVRHAKIPVTIVH